MAARGAADDFEKQRYEIVGCVGKGAYGSVYKVRSRQDGRTYVIKRITTVDPQAKQEIDILQRLRHPFVVSYKDTFEYDEHICIVMTYCAGGDLYHYIKDCKESSRLIDQELVMMWFAQLVLAMKYLHNKKILHRDLKTQNIFLTRRKDTVKLGDFGIAKVLKSTEEMALTVIGTPYYMSPELCTGVPYSFKSDVWALGCVLYELCTLEHAFDAKNLSQLVMKIMKGSYPPISTEYAPELRDLVDTMLHQNADSRPSIRDVASKPFVKRYVDKVEAKLRRHQLETSIDYGVADEVPRARVVPPRYGQKPVPLPPSRSKSDKELPIDDKGGGAGRGQDTSDRQQLPPRAATSDPSRATIGAGGEEVPAVGRRNFLQWSRRSSSAVEPRPIPAPQSGSGLEVFKQPSPLHAAAQQQRTEAWVADKPRPPPDVLEAFASPTPAAANSTDDLPGSGSPPQEGPSNAVAAVSVFRSMSADAEGRLGDSPQLGTSPQATALSSILPLAGTSAAGTPEGVGQYIGSGLPPSAVKSVRTDDGCSPATSSIDADHSVAEAPPEDLDIPSVNRAERCSNVARLVGDALNLRSSVEYPDDFEDDDDGTEPVVTVSRKWDELYEDLPGATSGGDQVDAVIHGEEDAETEEEYEDDFEEDELEIGEAEQTPDSLATPGGQDAARAAVGSTDTPNSRLLLSAQYRTIRRLCIEQLGQERFDEMLKEVRSAVQAGEDLASHAGIESKPVSMLVKWVSLCEQEMEEPAA